MKQLDLFNLLQEEIGGNIDNMWHNDALVNVSTISQMNPVYSNDNYNGHFIKLSFSDIGELIIDINKVPPFRLYIEPENFISKTLDKIGLSNEIKIKREEFDKKYQIKNINDIIAGTYFTDEVVDAINEIFPFIFLKFTYKEYRLMKDIDFSSYSIEHALHDIDSLIALITLTEEQQKNQR